MFTFDTPLATPTGWVAAADAVPGTVLVSPTGMTHVLGRSRHDVPSAFEVIFADSNSVVVSAEQPWRLSGGKVVSTATLRSEFDRLSNKGRTRSLHMDNPPMLELPALKHPYDPYHIGHAVGTKKDVPIPIEFRRGSIEQRKQTLAGLMDAGGTWNPSRRRCSFILRHPQTADSILELLVTFGFTPQLTVVTGGESTTYRIEWTPPFNPFTDREVLCRVTEQSQRRVVAAVRLLTGKPMVNLVIDSGEVLAGGLMVPVMVSSRTRTI